MAHPRAVAVRRQNADLRLKKAVDVASKRFGVPFAKPTTLPNRDAALYAAELIEGVAGFLENITSNKPERKAS
jgi:hypothetical protein